MMSSMYMYATKSDYEITVKTELGDKEGEKKFKGVGKKGGKKITAGWLPKIPNYICTSTPRMLCYVSSQPYFAAQPGSRSPMLYIV